MRFQGKSVIVTGGSSGIGKATVELFANEGARVLIADIDEYNAMLTVEKLRSMGKDVVFVKTDVSDLADCLRMSRTAIEEFGRIDVLCNNSGIFEMSDKNQVVDMDLATWQRVIDVNLTGTFLVSKMVLPIMRSQRSGSIVNTASISGLVSTSTGRSSAYNASKGALILLTKNMAVANAEFGIRVNSVCPGYVETPMSEKIFKDVKLKQDIMNRHPMKRFAQPEEIAKAILFLASDDASFITGTSLVIDGGYTAI